MTQLASAADTTTHREVYFIDGGLTDVDTLLAALPEGAPWYLIDAADDGVQQMAEVLADHAGLTAVHVLAHGTPGRMQLGNANIDRAALMRQVCQWEEIGAALYPDGDLLFYACELAGGRRGTDFIDAVYQLTGVNIAASRSLVGAAALGGSWDLGAQVGPVKARALNVGNYAGVLASPTVIEPATLDASFDQPLDAADPGIVTTSFGGFYGAATAVLVDVAGKVIVAGWHNVGDPGAPTSSFHVARYNADGSLDTTFSGDGMATASFGGAPAAANAIAMDSLARIVAVGYAGDQYAIARFNDDGTPDTSFGVGGELTGSFGAAIFSTANGIAFAGTDIVIAGTADGDFGVARIDDAGTLSQSVTTDIAGGSQDFVAAVSVLADNTILVAGSAYDGTPATNFVLAKYNVADLSLTGLGGSGIANVDFGGGMDVASAMAIDAVGRAVLVGTRISGVDNDFVIARYNTDGSLDASFGGGSGWLVTDFGGSTDEAFAVAIQGDGKIVVSGRTSVAGGQYDTVFARYNPNGSLDTGFGGDGLMTVAVDLGGVPNDDFAAAMAIASNGEIIAVGSALDAATGQTGAVIINLTPVVPTLAAVAEDTVNPLGASVLSLVGANFSDPDLGDSLGGIAIAGDTSPGQGVWEYSSDNGANWFAVGPVDAGNALLVAAGDLLRFVPAADFSGTPGGLTLHLVDTASGVTFSNGALRQVLLNGSATAGVSVDTITLSTNVTAVADAPTLNPASLAAIVEGTASPAGQSVLDLFGAGFADVDGVDVFAGIAIAGDAATAAQGVWEYSVDGVAWNVVGPVSAGAALLLDASAQLRFVPTIDFQGVPGALAVHAVDSSAALSFTIDPFLPQTFDTTTDLETSGVAVASAGLSVNVTNISDAPTILYSMMPNPAFGSGGLATTEFGVTPISELAVGVALQASGQIVVAGSTFDNTSTAFAVARYDASGVLDGSFGSGGKLTTQFVEGDATAEALAVAPLSNNIIVAGSVFDGLQSDFAVARYNAATGALDTTFGGDGMVTTAIGAGEDVATSMSIDGGGQIVVAGYSHNGTDLDFAVARYNPGGSLDTSFSGDGIATVNFGGSDLANAVLALGDGKVIVAGDSGGVFAVARFNEDGTLDTTFDGDGILTTDVGGAGFSIATTLLEQADGKILVGGYASGVDFAFNFALVRYNTDGSLDLGFGIDGMVTTDFGQGDDYGASVIIDADGKIVLSGTAANADFGQDMAFARYNADGSLDTSFGTGGLLQLAIASGSAAAIASTMTAGGDLLAAGWAANVDGSTDFAVVQLTAATSVALASIDEDAAIITGGSVANLFANSFHDVDGDTLAGVAVSANSATPGQGVWEYSTDAGTNWLAVGSVSAGGALLLSADSVLRFLPATNYHGTPGGLEVHLVDSSNTATFTAGAVTQVFDTTADGQTSAVSANSIGLVTSVISINDAPTGNDGTVTVLEDNARVLSAADFGFADIDAGDVLASVQITDISLSGTLTLNGFTVFSLDTIQRADIDAGLLVFQPLADGSGAAYASISFLVNDGADSALVPNTLTFDVTVVNDAPVLTVDIAGGVTEDAAAPTLTDTGVLSFSDADAGDLVTVSSAYNTDAVWSGGALSVAQIAALTAGFSNDLNSWDYSVANADLQFLAAGETVTFSYTVTAADNSTALNNGDSAVVTMTLSGTNDAPVLTVNVAGAVTEDATVPTLTDTGVLSFSDVDATDIVTVTSAYNSDAVWSGGTLSIAQIAGLTAGFSNDQNSWDYSVANADLQFLGAGETVTFGYTLTATDNSGTANNSASQVVTMTLTGSNDAPALTTASADLGAGTEDQVYVVSLAQLLAGWSDPDGDPLAVANVVADHGTVTDNQDGTFTVTPAAYFYGSMNLGYDIIDGRGGVVAATLAYSLTAVRNDMYVPGSVGNDTLWGDQIDAGSWDTLDGGDGDDSLNGLGGNDTLLGAAGTDWLDGGTGADLLWGGDGNDVMIGGFGVDTMTGGVGNDVYEVTDAGDVVVENAGEGEDTIWTSLASYTLEENAESLMFGGSGNFAGTGNGQGNLIQGRDGNDILNGLGGHDVLIGGYGDDTLTGGVGNDVYEVTDAGDVVVENAGEGADTIWTSLASYTLEENVENLMFGGSGNFAGTGNGGDNLIQGKGGDDVLNGLVGHDVLIGGWGADTLTGGVGNDVYEVTDAGDLVVENADAGGDTIWTSLASYTLEENVENLMFGGSGNFAGAGNGVGNLIQGRNGDDILDGLAGNDSLIGGWGADTLTGGVGNDVYEVTDAGDLVVEIAGEGEDTVWTSLASYTLAENVENLMFGGSGNFAGTGNGLGNIVQGKEGNDVLNGLGGNDALIGGAGNDVFVFSATGFGRDRVLDFDADPAAGQDLLDISGLGITAATFASAVTIQDLGADTLLSFAGGDSIHLAGIGDATTITASDFLLAA